MVHKFRPPSSEGLPPDWDPRYIPSQNDLIQASMRALEDRIAFVLLHQDEPHRIADELNDIAGIVQATCGVEGSHRHKAIMLGLQLTFRFWSKQRNIEAWQAMLMNMLSAAYAMNDTALSSQIYGAWGLYWYIAGQQNKSEKALQTAQEFADEAGREDLVLLVQVEQFNAQATRLTTDELTARARTLLYQAEDALIKARIYLALARGLRVALDHEQTFMYAQQALVIFDREGWPNLVVQSLGLMITSIQSRNPRSVRLRSRLLAYMARLNDEYKDALVVNSTYYFHLCVYYFQNKDYEMARLYAVKHWLDVSKNVNSAKLMAQPRHMLGMIAAGQGRWEAARLHLKAAITAHDSKEYTMTARHALAFIPFQQGRYAEAIAELSAVRDEAECIVDESAREKFVDNITADIEKARRRLNEQSTNE